MPEMGTSGLMSGDGKRGVALRVSTRARPRLYLRRASARRRLKPALPSRSDLLHVYTTEADTGHEITGTVH